MTKTTFAVKQRDLKTRPDIIRREQRIVGNIYGADIDSTPIQFEESRFEQLQRKVGETGLIYLKIDDKQIPVLIGEIQHNPVTGQVTHVSFKQVNLKEKVESLVPVEIEGDIDIPEAVLVVVRDEVEVKALPTDLPEKFVVNVTNLTEIGQSITLADLEYDREKVDVVVGDEGLESPVVLVQQVLEEPEEEAEVETEIIGEKEEVELDQEGGEEEQQDQNSEDQQ